MPEYRLSFDTWVQRTGGWKRVYPAPQWAMFLNRWFSWLPAFCTMRFYWTPIVWREAP